MNTEFRIYTEAIGDIRSIVGRYFDGYTMVPTEGVWRGVSENSVMIVIIAERSERTQVLAAADDIRRENKQTAVLVTESPMIVTFVTDSPF